MSIYPRTLPEAVGAVDPEPQRIYGRAIWTDQEGVVLASCLEPPVFNDERGRWEVWMAVWTAGAGTRRALNACWTGPWFAPLAGLPDS